MSSRSWRLPTATSGWPVASPSQEECDPAAGYVSVIDPSTNRIVRDGHVACPVSLVVHDRDVWVGTDDPDGPQLQRIQPVD